MIQLSHSEYIEIFNKLEKTIGQANYFTGRVEGIFKNINNIKWSLVGSFVVYRNDKNEISDIVGCWYDLHTYFIDEPNEETMNDFAFCLLRELLK